MLDCLVRTMFGISSFFLVRGISLSLIQALLISLIRHHKELLFLYLATLGLLLKYIDRLIHRLWEVQNENHMLASSQTCNIPRPKSWIIASALTILLALKARWKYSDKFARTPKITFCVSFVIWFIINFLKLGVQICSQANLFLTI